MATTPIIILKILVGYCILFVLITLVSCSSTEYKRIGSNETVLIDRSFPFFPQEENSDCGPIALSMLMKYWCKNNNYKENLDIEFANKKKSGVALGDLLDFASRNGFNAHLYYGSPRDLAEQIQADIPVIAVIDTNSAFNLPLPLLKILLKKKFWGHAMVVFGFDDKSREVIVHNPEHPEVRVPYDVFFKKWGASNWVTFVIWPKDGCK